MNERLSRNQLDGENGLKAEKDKDLGNMLKRIEKNVFLSNVQA